MLFSPMKKTFDSIESVVADIRRGKMVIVVDDADRENEGDLIMAGAIRDARRRQFHGQIRARTHLRAGGRRTAPPAGH